MPDAGMTDTRTPSPISVDEALMLWWLLDELAHKAARAEVLLEEK